MFWRRCLPCLKDDATVQPTPTPPQTTVDPQAPQTSISDVVVIDRVTSSVHMHAPRQFSFTELSLATNNFSEMLGKGGFGTVFKGTLLCDHSDVAVKRLTHKDEVDLRSFEHEVTILAKVSHRNLVKLRGWCIDRQEYMVVYELLPNGSLDRFLFGDGNGCTAEVLSWERRFRIVLGVGSALSYLHDSAAEHTILHRDLKPNNILLDGDYESKLGDFGLSRELDDGKTGHTTQVAGTNGYMAPEMMSSGRATKKSDVYGYGGVLAAVACGKKAVDREASPSLLIDRLWQYHGRNRLLEMVDKRLQPLDESEKQQLTRVLLMALACCHPDPARRPASIASALEMLEGRASLPDVPLTKPRLFYAEQLLPPTASSETDANSSRSTSANYCSATFGSQTLAGR